MLKRVFKLFQIARKLSSSGAIDIINQVHQIPLSINFFFSLISIGSDNNRFENNKSQGEKLCIALQAMGTTFIKLGQFLATRPDIIGEHMAKDLEKLQDKVPAFDIYEAKRLIKKEIGEKLSNVTLLNINATATSLNDYSGKYVFISFIFTRCPVPNMCPAVVIKNGVIARNFKDYDNVKLVMVSFDYLYDTPEVLKSFYGSSIENFPNWDVLSSVGKISDLYTLSSEIGCEYWGIEKNNIGHNLRSALIGPDKTLLKIWEGDDWLAGSVSKEIENYIKFAQ